MSNDKQETIPMGKTVMVLVIPEPKVRKATAKPVRKHKDKTAYSRKAKHKTPRMGVFFCIERKPPARREVPKSLQLCICYKNSF